jgi:ribosomal protein S18 acetylase RimI-like enzyme
MAALRAISSDPMTAVTLARRALDGRAPTDAEVAPFLAAVEREVTEGTAAGALLEVSGDVVGLALWETTAALGTTVQLLHLEPGHQSVREYGEFFRAVQEHVGPVAFAPGFLSGLDEAGETALMEELGFERFSRSEMRRDLTTPVEIGPAPVGSVARPATLEDLPALARLHEAAYRDRFDRFLFLVYADPSKDAELAVREILTGRWGEFLPYASPVLPEGEDLRAAALVVRAPYGPLVADVMVDPRWWGHGLGAAVVRLALGALRDHHETTAVLNVTEGNERALRLYRRLGFSVSLGPSRGWYSPTLVPIPPRPRSPGRTAPPR